MRISVLITSYNQITYLREALESVLNQTEKPFEIIVCDDCSHDGSQNLIREYQRKFPELIRHFLHQENLGIPRNKNFAINQAKGDWVVGLDGDDWFVSHKLAATRKQAEKQKNAKIIFGNFAYVDSKGKHIALWVNPGFPAPPTGRVFAQVFSKEYPHNNLFRNEAIYLDGIREVGGYDLDMDIYEDWELRVRLARNCDVAYCDDVLSYYRCHERGISQLDSKVHIDYIRKILQKNMQLLKLEPLGKQENILRKHLRLEVPFAINVIKGHIKSLDFSAAVQVWNESRRYRIGRIDAWRES